MTDFDDNGSDTSGMVKRCCTCKKVLSREFFGLNSRRKDKIHYRCKLCEAENGRTRRRKRNTIINEIKYKNPCMDCKNFYPPISMQFEHVRGTKLFSIGRALGTNISISMILDEITKCELVCANCHAVRTWTRINEKI